LLESINFTGKGTFAGMDVLVGVNIQEVELSDKDNHYEAL